MSNPGTADRQAKPGPAVEELRRIRDELYADMKKHPEALVPWAIISALEKINGIIGTNGNKPPGEMARVVGSQEAESSVVQQLRQFLAENTGRRIAYGEVSAAFPNANKRYLTQTLARFKSGELPLPEVGGGKYAASGRKGEIIVAIGETAAGKARLQLKTPEDTFLSRIITYLKGAEGTDITRKAFLKAFPGSNAPTLSSYFSRFTSGEYTIKGYKITHTGWGKLRVEKIKTQEDLEHAGDSSALITAGQPAPSAGAAQTIQPGAQNHGASTPGAGPQSYREEVSRLYATEVGTIKGIYDELPGLKNMIGDRTGFENTVLIARNRVRPEKVGSFYDALEKIPLDHGRMGTQHDDFLRLAIRDQDSAYRMMSWLSRQDDVTAEMFTAELVKYRPVNAR